MDIDSFKRSLLFEPTDKEIDRFIKKSIDIKKKLAKGRWDINNYENNTLKDGGDGIPELVGYNLSSVWKDITHQKSEFYKLSIKLPEKNTNNGRMSLRYSRTNLQEIERVIKTYMRKGDYFLENCCGWSTFGAMAAYYGYNGIGVDIWDVALNKSIEQYNEIKDIPNIGKLDIIEMDGMDLKFNDDSFDFVYCNPPFMDSEKYSCKYNDVMDKDINKFLAKLKKIISENHRVLKNDCLCVITINDYRKDSFLIPMQKHVIDIGLEVGFKLWDFVIAELVSGRNLIMRKDHYKVRRTAKQHEYVIVFKKLGDSPKVRRQKNI